MSSARVGKPYPKEVDANVILASINDPIQIIINTAETNNVVSPNFVPLVLYHFKMLDQTDKSGLAKSKWESTKDQTPSPWNEILIWSKMFAQQTEIVDNDKNNKDKQKKLIMISDKLLTALTELEKVKINAEDKNAGNAIKCVVCLFQGLYQRAVKKDKENSFYSTSILFKQTKQTRIQSLESIHTAIVNLAKKFSDTPFYKEFDQANKLLENDIAAINKDYPVISENVQKAKSAYNITEEDIQSLEKEARSLEVAAPVQNNDKSLEKSTTANLKSRLNTNVVRTSIVDMSIQTNHRMFDNLVRMRTQLRTEEVPELKFDINLAKEMNLTSTEIEQWNKNWERILDVQDRQFFDETNPIWGSLIESTVSVFKYGVDFFQTCFGKLQKLTDETENVNDLLKSKIDNAIAHVEKNIIIFNDIKPELNKLADKLNQYILKKEDAKDVGLERKKIAEDIYDILNPEKNSFVSPEQLLNRLEETLNSAQANLAALKSTRLSSGDLTGIIKDAKQQIDIFRKKYHLEQDILPNHPKLLEVKQSDQTQITEVRARTFSHR